MRTRRSCLRLLASGLAAAPTSALAQAANHNQIWKPAPPPPGGISWALLETTEEITRKDRDGYLRSRPKFSPTIKGFAGRRVLVAGWMMPLEAQAAQEHFVLLGYPPGCPFHTHALPTQFIEVFAAQPFRLDEVNVTNASGVLELTGEDESGIFYRLRDARPA